MAISIISVSAELLPYLKKEKVLINIDHSEVHTSLFLKTVNLNIFKTEPFTKGLEKLMSPGINPPPSITEQLNTIKSIYTDLNNLFERRNKMLGTHINNPESCQVIYQIFSDAYATHIVQELLLIVSDLPDPTTDLSKNLTKKTNGILMQALLNLNKIYLYLNNEVLELENVINYITTPHTFLAVQNSACIDSLANERIHITHTQASPNGLIIFMNIIQYKHTLNTYSLIPTPYFGFTLDLTDVFLIDDNLAICTCIYTDTYVRTGCVCSPLEQTCNQAIEENNIMLMLDNCKIIPEQTFGPQPTITGVLFSSYLPFTLEGSDLDHQIPPPSFELPFHVSSRNKFEITYQGRKLHFQAASAIPADSIEIPEISPEVLQQIKNKLNPISPTFFYEVLTYTLACLACLFLIPLIILLTCKNPTILNNIRVSNPSDRRQVNLTLTKLI